MENQYRNLADQLKIIKREVFEESKLKFPSVYSLEKAGKNSFALLKECSIQDLEYITWADWKSRHLDIFVEDLTGELKHDFEKRNVRYNGKWQIQERKLNELLSDFQIKFHQEINRQ